MFTAFILWLLFGIFSAVIASNKGRSGIGWFFVGVFFGPFGLLVAVLPALKKEEQETPAQKGSSWKRLFADFVDTLLSLRIFRLEFSGQKKSSNGGIR
jgi:hypothetical protein